MDPTPASTDTETVTATAKVNAGTGTRVLGRLLSTRSLTCITILAFIASYYATGFFFDDLIVYTTLFFWPLIWFPSLALGLASLALLVMNQVKRDRPAEMLAQLVVVAACIWLAESTDLRMWRVRANFHYYNAPRTRVVDYVASKHWENVEGRVKLPPDLRSFTIVDDQVFVVVHGDRTWILFPTFSGILGKGAGVLYISDDSYRIDVMANRDITRSEKLAPSWYWVAYR